MAICVRGRVRLVPKLASAFRPSSRWLRSKAVTIFAYNITSDLNPAPKFDLSHVEKAIIENRSDMPVADIQNPYKKPPVQCILCKYNIELDYKNTKLLSQFVSPFTGRIYEKSVTGLCSKQQDRVKREIKKSQSFGYMPFVNKEVGYLKDPQLFDPINLPKKY